MYIHIYTLQVFTPAHLPIHECTGNTAVYKQVYIYIYMYIRISGCVCTTSRPMYKYRICIYTHIYDLGVAC